MSYQVSLSNKSQKQYKNFDRHIQEKIKAQLQQLEEKPHEGFSLSGKYAN